MMSGHPAVGPAEVAARLVRQRRRRARSRLPPAGLGAGKSKSEINVTPLVDVVLVLLIIFMVVTPLLHRGVPIDLPETAHHARNDGTYVEADRLDDAALDVRLRQELRSPARAVHVRADRSLKYGRVRAVLEALHVAGAGVIGMGSEERR